jgi:cyclase
MLRHRVIPCLLIQNNSLVKTFGFKNPKYIGDPINAIKIFNEKEVDELMLLDITASKLKKSPNFNLIEEIASECFMPLAYGGGISSLQDAEKLISLGVEKICLQSAVLDDTSLITEISERSGSQSVIVSIDVKKNWRGKYQLYSSAKKRSLSLPLAEYVNRVIEAGAGEILLNSINRDGQMQGMDINIIKEISQLASIPVTAVGGVGSLSDIRAAIDAGASAVGVGAFFVLNGPHKAVLISYPKYNDLVNLFNT